VTEYSADVLVEEPGAEEERSERNEAKDFLREVLSEGAVPFE